MSKTTPYYNTRAKARKLQLKKVKCIRLNPTSTGISGNTALIKLIDNNTISNNRFDVQSEFIYHTRHIYLIVRLFHQFNSNQC